MNKGKRSSGNSFCRHIILCPLIVLLGLGLFACGDDDEALGTTYTIFQWTEQLGPGTFFKV